jgi:hypothetical protein
MMPPYPIYCHRKGCGKPAVYKIAARWSDGATEELKTYALCCEECLPDLYHRSREKQKACRLAARETLETPGVYRLQHGQRDRGLERLKELEDCLNAAR